MTTRFIFFSGILKKGKKFADPDARIGYCASKKRAFVGYRCTLLIDADTMLIVDYYVTPANRHDSGAVVPMLLKLEKRGIISRIKSMYGDNAYYTKEIKKWLNFYGVKCRLHNKDESGLHRKSKRSGRSKSRVRTKVEGVFGIAKMNLNFEKLYVRGLSNVKIDITLKCIRWNIFYLYSYIEGRMEDRISIRRLLYEN